MYFYPNLHFRFEVYRIQPTPRELPAALCGCRCSCMEHASDSPAAFPGGGGSGACGLGYGGGGGGGHRSALDPDAERAAAPMGCTLEGHHVRWVGVL